MEIGLQYLRVAQENNESFIIPTLYNKEPPQMSSFLSSMLDQKFRFPSMYLNYFNLILSPKYKDKLN